MKPKINRKGDPNKSHKMDQCQTPPYALNPLLPYIKQFKHIWEPAAGEGYLVRTLEKNGFIVTATDILTGQNLFLVDSPPEGVEAIVTNLPYSVKYGLMLICIELQLPFALLMPVEMLGAAAGQELFEKCNAELIVYKQRVDFKMPNAGWKKSSAQFPTMWVTSKLNIGRQITYADLNKPSKKERDKWADEN